MRSLRDKQDPGIGDLFGRVVRKGIPYRVHVAQVVRL
jgi:hypothetical protein